MRPNTNHILIISNSYRNITILFYFYNLIKNIKLQCIMGTFFINKEPLRRYTKVKNILLHAKECKKIELINSSVK